MGCKTPRVEQQRLVIKSCKSGKGEDIHRKRYITIRTSLSVGQKRPVKRGRSTYWDPLTATPPPDAVPEDEPVTVKTIRNFVIFCIAQGLEIGGTAVVPYGESQRLTGLDGSVVANNMQTVRYITADNWEQAIAQARVSHFISSLRADKARNGGPKRKPLLDIHQLMSPIRDLNLASKKDGFYAAVWCIPQRSFFLA